MESYFTNYVSPDVSQLITSYIGLTRWEIGICSRMINDYNPIFQQCYEDFINGRLTSGMLGDFLWRFRLDINTSYLEYEILVGTKLIYPPCIFCDIRYNPCPACVTRKRKPLTIYSSMKILI